MTAFDHILDRYEQRDLVRVLTCGSVDDGKSTLIGRMLHDAGAVFDDQLDAVRRETRRRGSAPGEIDFSLLVDGLEAEREQGITIDVAYRYFSTPRRKFIVADTPGHVQYTRNMATGASNCDLAVILADARSGVLSQTRRHAFIASLLGIRHLVVAVNKMDTVDWSEERFDAIRRDFSDFAARLQVGDVEMIPLSALHGDNVVHRSDRMPWYEGRPLLDHLETVHVASDRNMIDFRFPVQYVSRGGGVRSYAGTIASGIVRCGDEIVILPSLRRTRIASILGPSGDAGEAFAPMAVTITFVDDVDVSRGDVFVHANNVAQLGREIEAMVVWMSETPLRNGAEYLVKLGTVTTPATMTSVRYRTNIETLRREDASSLALNEIGRVHIETARPIAFDAYARNRATGSFILIDRISNETAGAGMVLDRETGEGLARRKPAADAGTNIRLQHGAVAPSVRARRLGQSPAVVWLTGLPRSGKSSLAMAIEKTLCDRGMVCQALDGENLRLGVSSDLGFSIADRREAVRRAAEVARLLCENGIVVVVALVSGSRADREMARAILEGYPFHEVFCSAPLDVCEQRDSDELFARARRGELYNVTGIDLQYEPPISPDLTLDTAGVGVEENVGRVLALLERS